MLGIEGVSHAPRGGGYSRQRAELMQRPWGMTVPSVLEERPGGLCGWSRVSSGREGEVRAGRGWCRCCRALGTEQRTQF